MKRLWHILLATAFISVIAFVAGARWLVQEADAPGPLAAEKLAYIVPGTPIKNIAQQLQDEGIVRHSLAFTLWARWENLHGGLKAGEYSFAPGISVHGILSLLQSGKTHQRQITLPEGLMVTEIVALLKEEPLLTGDIARLPAEGALLPETYNFLRNDARQALLDRMKKAMQEEIAQLWPKRAEGLPFKTPEEAVVLASIVEKETGVASERPRVAGVFINRLNKGIPLQSDPTVIYAMTKGAGKLERALTSNDLKTSSPYNTYLVTGLPPAPIANPGKASLAAVLNPEKNDYLYFVADGSGGHAFARTLQEHNTNVARWRKIRKNQTNQ